MDHGRKIPANTEGKQQQMDTLDIFLENFIKHEDAKLSIRGSADILKIILLILKTTGILMVQNWTSKVTHTQERRYNKY